MGFCGLLHFYRVTEVALSELVYQEVCALFARHFHISVQKLLFVFASRPAEFPKKKTMSQPLVMKKL